MDLENLRHGERAADKLNGLPGKGRPVEMPDVGMPKTSGNKNSNAGTFYAPACPGYRGCFVGGKPPPPTVPSMQHNGTLAYTEWKSPCHCTVRQGSGAKEAAVSGGGIEEEHGEVV